MREFSASELDALDRLNLSGSPTSPASGKGTHSPMTPSKMNISQTSSGSKAQKVNIEALERQAEEQLENKTNGLNGHA